MAGACCCIALMPVAKSKNATQMYYVWLKKTKKWLSKKLPIQ